MGDSDFKKMMTSAPAQSKTNLRPAINGGPRKIGFFLPSSVSMMGLNGAIETSRHANQATNRELYTWITIAKELVPIRATNNLLLYPDQDISQPLDVDLLFVCGGKYMREYRDPKVFRWLREQAFAGTIIGAITTGTYILAHAGLLNGYECTIDLADEEDFKEDYPEINLSRKLYVMDRNRLTSAGGTTSIDFFLNIISADYGPELAIEVANNLHVDRIRSLGDEQSQARQKIYGIQSNKLAEIIELMEGNVEDPLGLEKIASIVSLTNRQIRRLFEKYVKMSPANYYKDIRIRRARQFVHTTSMPLMEISIATGFTTHSHFTKCYREAFGRTPRKDRTMLAPSSFQYDQSF